MFLRYRRLRDGAVVHVVHVVGPDFRRLGAASSSEGAMGGAAAEAEAVVARHRSWAVERLAECYTGILSEFTRSGQPELRLLPVSGGIFLGPFARDVAALTYEALAAGFAQLPLHARRGLLLPQPQARSPAAESDAPAVKRPKRIELCVFAEKEFADFKAAGFRT